jgi:hypothetical protein
MQGGTTRVGVRLRGGATKLDAGKDLLAEVLVPRGFRYEHVKSGSSSGGLYSVGRWIKGDRAIELHVRGDLGIVMYRRGDQQLDHRSYMQRLGVSDPAYPGFGREPLDAFIHLRADLETHCKPFIDGTDDDRFVNWASEPLVEGTRLLP